MFKSHSDLAGSFHFFISGLTLEPVASALGSRGLGEVDSHIHLFLTSCPLGCRHQASFSGALHVHFHFGVFSGGSWGNSPQVRGYW